MPRRPLDLVSHWHIPAPADQVWAALTNPAGWPAWWPAVRAAQALRPRQAAGATARWHLAWAAGGPFRGTLALETLEALPLERWRLMSGARPAAQAGAIGPAHGASPASRPCLHGECIWLLQTEDGHTQVTQVWRLRAPPGPRGWLRPLATPLLRWLHGRVMRQGAVGLARHLARHPGQAAPNPSR